MGLQRVCFLHSGKPALTYREFEAFLNDLSEFRKIHPDVVILRLRAAGSRDLQSKLLQFSLAEGNVDRIIDAFRFDVNNISDQFIDLSREPYQEPLCYGVSDPRLEGE